MHVADNVKGAMLRLAIVPQRLAHDRRGGNRLDRLQEVDMAKALLFQVAQGAAQLLALLADDMVAKVPVSALAVAFVAKLFGQVEHNRNRQHVIVTRQFDQRLARLGLDIGGIDHREPTRGQALGCDKVQNLKGRLARTLVVFVISRQAATEVGGEDFGRLEVLTGKGRFAGARRANQDNERKFGNGQGRHRVKTPIWVGAPRVGSAGPTPRKRTV